MGTSGPPWWREASGTMFRRDWLSSTKGRNTEDLYEIFVYVKRNAAFSSMYGCWPESTFSGMYGCWPSYCLKNNFHVLAAPPLHNSCGYQHNTHRLGKHPVHWDIKHIGKQVTKPLNDVGRQTQQATIDFTSMVGSAQSLRQTQRYGLHSCTIELNMPVAGAHQVRAA